MESELYLELITATEKFSSAENRILISGSQRQKNSDLVLPPRQTFGLTFTSAPQPQRMSSNPQGRSMGVERMSGVTWGVLRRGSHLISGVSGAPRSGSEEHEVGSAVQTPSSFWSFILQCQGIRQPQAAQSKLGILVCMREYCLGSSNIKKLFGFFSFCGPANSGKETPFLLVFSRELKLIVQANKSV